MGTVHPAQLGRFFEDYTVGQTIRHAVPRTVAEGERALYHALYPARHALYSSDEFARASGLPASPLDDLAAFHTVFGKTVPDISLNATLNPDFSQIEADEAQVSMNDTFALFFDEKRAFFLDNKDYFSSPLDLVYTRNIGAPDLGAKLTGKQQQHSFAFFAANDAKTTRSSYG